MKKKYVAGAIVILAAVVTGTLLTNKQSPVTQERPTLSVGLGPFQDMAMIVNTEPLGLEDTYNLDLDLVTLAWEDLIPSVSSAQNAVDVAFTGLIEFVNNERNLNRNTDDPVVFIYPTYLFLGGSFVSFNPEVPVITRDDLDDPEKLKEFLSYSFGAQVKSLPEIMLFAVTKAAGIDFKEIDLFNVGYSDGLLAAINGDIDIAGAGLTQRNEALKQGGRVVLTSKDVGFVDVAGFVTKRSTLENKRDEIEKLINMWFENVDYIFSDIQTNATYTIAYLDQKSSTNYTPLSYEQALSQEFFPRSVEEMEESVLSGSGAFHFDRVLSDLTSYLLENDFIDEAPQNIEIITVD